MSKVKSIEFVFENCESLIIPVEGISYFHTGVIQECFSGGGINISLNRYIDGFTAVFSKDVKVSTDDYTQWLTDEEKPSLERFKGCDVTQLILTQEDETITHMHVLWYNDDNNWQSCDGQECLISNKGNYLFFSKGGNYESGVDIEDVDEIVRFA